MRRALAALGAWLLSFEYLVGDAPLKVAIHDARRRAWEAENELRKLRREAYALEVFLTRR